MMYMGGIAHALSNHLLACGIGAWLGTFGVAARMSCTSQSVFCYIFLSFAFGGRSATLLMDPYLLGGRLFDGPMRQRTLGLHTPPCHRRMVITTQFNVLPCCTAAQTSSVPLRVAVHLGQLAPTTLPRCRLVSNSRSAGLSLSLSLSLAFLMGGGGGGNNRHG